MRSSRRSTSFASASGAAPAAANALQHALLGEAFAKARFGQQLVLDEAPHAGRLVGERALVEFGEDRVVRAREQIRGDLGAALRDTRVVELAADEAQQRRLDFGVAQLRSAGDEAHDRLGDLLGHELAAGLHHRARAPAAPVIRASRIRFCVIDGIAPFSAFEMREVVLAQRDQDRGSRCARNRNRSAAVSSCSIRASSAFGGRFSTRSARSSMNCAARCAAEIVALREREDLLELVEDQQRHERACPLASRSTSSRWCRNSHSDSPSTATPGCVHVPGGLGRAEDRLLDLLRRRRRSRE